jgi:long-subunit acyl-CoA synthetase (AMP-forming)
MVSPCARRTSGSGRRSPGRQFWDLVELAAHGLLALGVEPGDRVSIHSEDRPEWVILDMATVAVRGITVGLYPTNPAAEVEYLLADSGVKVHLAEDQEQADKVLEVIDTCPNLEKIIHVEPRGFRPCATTTASSSGTTSSSWGGSTASPPR